MGIVVLNPGLLTTVQDMGRTGYQQFGVPVSGAMDARSAAIANILAGNGQEEAVLECTLMGPDLAFDCDNTIAITGGDLTPVLDETPIPMYRAIYVRKGQTLRCLAPRTGCRAYIAFMGGLDIPVVMGSRSTYLRARIGGLEGRKLQKGDVIRFRRPGIPPNMEVRFLTPEFVSQQVYTLRTVSGPQASAFLPEGIQTFFTQTYSVTCDFDRMGCRLDGPAIRHIRDGNIISDGIAFGAVQVPTEGKPIIMLADRQTVGGYAKIATVITADFRILAQLKAGDRVRFCPVSVQQAQSILLARRAALRTLSSVNICQSLFEIRK